MFQVNTLVSRETLDDLPAIEALVREVVADRWSLFFLVSVGRGTVLNAITPKETEALLEWLADRSKVPGLAPRPLISTGFRCSARATRSRARTRNARRTGAVITRAWTAGLVLCGSSFPERGSARSECGGAT